MDKTYENYIEKIKEMLRELEGQDNIDIAIETHKKCHDLIDRCKEMLLTSEQKIVEYSKESEVGI